MFSLLTRNHRYARLWAGESVSILGDYVTGLALPIVAIAVLGAPAWQVGVLTAAAWIPYVFALVIGTVVDRIAHKRLLLILSDLVRAAALLSVPLAFLTDRLTVGQLIGVAITTGLAGVVSQTAYTSFFVRVVDADDILTANSLNSTSRSAAGLGGPPLAGWLIQTIGAPIALLVDCASYLVSALSLAGLRVSEPELPRSREPVVRQALDGLTVLLRDRWLSSILWCTSLMNFASFAVVATVLVFATQVVHLEPAAIGTAQGIGAVGALVGALVAARVASRVGLFATVLSGTVLASLPYFLLGLIRDSAPLSEKVALYAACLFGVAAGIMLYDVVINSVMIKVMPDAIRGRLIGAFSSINYGIRPAGALLGGAAATVWGPRATILVAAGLGLLAILPLLRSPLRTCRGLDDIPAAAPAGGPARVSEPADTLSG